VQVLQGFMFYCMFYFTCDRSLRAEPCLLALVVERSVDGAAEVLRAMILGDGEVLEVLEVVDDEDQLVTEDDINDDNNADDADDDDDDDDDDADCDDDDDDEGVAKDAEVEELVLSAVVEEETEEDRLQVAQHKLASGSEQSSIVHPAALSPYSQPATAIYLY